MGVTKGCCLSWLTNSALVLSPNAGGEMGGCGVSANECSCAHGAQINFGDLILCIYPMGQDRPVRTEWAASDSWIGFVYHMGCVIYFINQGVRFEPFSTICVTQSRNDGPLAEDLGFWMWNNRKCRLQIYDTAFAMRNYCAMLVPTICIKTVRHVQIY